jgi:hypothetical protein
MKNFFILFLVLIRQAFSGEFSGGDKIDLGTANFLLPPIEKGELTGADKPKKPDPKFDAEIK